MAYVRDAKIFQDIFISKHLLIKTPKNLREKKKNLDWIQRIKRLLLTQSTTEVAQIVK